MRPRPPERLDGEEAGNRVGRLDAETVGAELGKRGFRILQSQRYGMYYRHEPGRMVRLLSCPGLCTVSKASFRLVNSVAGRFGNKLAVVAIRP